MKDCITLYQRSRAGVTSPIWTAEEVSFLYGQRRVRRMSTGTSNLDLAKAIAESLFINADLRTAINAEMARRIASRRLSSAELRSRREASDAVCEEAERELIISTFNDLIRYMDRGTFHRAAQVDMGMRLIAMRQRFERIRT